jgi:hypothetical protein
MHTFPGRHLRVANDMIRGAFTPEDHHYHRLVYCLYYSRAFHMLIASNAIPKSTVYSNQSIMHIADYEPREELVYHLHLLYFQFDQPSADNLADWDKIVRPLTLKFPINVSLPELWDFFEENRYLMTTPFTSR